MASKTRQFSFVLLLAFALISSVGAVGTDYLISEKNAGIFGGQLVVSQIGEPETFNPLLAQGQATIEALDVVFDSLILKDEDSGSFHPRLAKSWSFSEDGLSVDFHIRQGVSFHDGWQLSADDVIFSLDVLFDRGVTAPLKWEFVKDGGTITYSKVDNYTVRVGLPSSDYDILGKLCMLKIIPKHLLEKAWSEGRFNKVWGINTPLKEIVGTGPYTLTTYKPNGYIVYTRVAKDFWIMNTKKQALPYITRYIRMIVKDYATSMLKFRAGETDILKVAEKDLSYMKNIQSKENFTIFTSEKAGTTTFTAVRNRLLGWTTANGRVEEFYYVK